MTPEEQAEYRAFIDKIVKDAMAVGHAELEMIVDHWAVEKLPDGTTRPKGVKRPIIVCKACRAHAVIFSTGNWMSAKTWAAQCQGKVPEEPKIIVVSS